MSFGNWQLDEQGLPCYNYTGNIPWAENPSKIQKDPYFILGNDRLTVFTHVSGAYQFITGERSWMKVNHKHEFTGDNAATIQVGDSAPLSLIGEDSELAREAAKVFGTGFAKFTYSAEHFTLDRILTVLPGKGVGDSVPTLRVDLSLTNSSDKDQTYVISELMGVWHRMLNTLYAPDEYPSIKYSQVISEQSESLIRLTTNAISADKHLLVPIERRARYDAHAPDVYMAVSGEHVAVSATLDERDYHNLSATQSVSLASGESTQMTVYIGLCFPQQADEPQQHLNTLEEAETGSEIPYRDTWSKRLPHFEKEPDADLRREMVWNAYVLEAMATYSLCFKETYIPQGTVYDYATGNTAAPRDHLQHLLGVIPHNPALARSCLRFVMNKEMPNGCIVYTETGYGHTSDLLWHTSDQQLYLMNALAEYCRISGNYDFLTEDVPYCFGESASVLEHIERAFVYFRDEVRTGYHGLPRIMNSDWNDGIFTLRPLSKYFWAATSHMNAAMASIVLQQMADMLEEAVKRGILTEAQTADLITSVKAYREQLTEALMKDMEGRIYARRAWLTDDEALGDEEMFLEPQGFLLQIPEFTLERKKALTAEIEKRLGGEVLGCRHIEKPEDGGGEGLAQPHGEGENAGIWYALQGPLIIGLNHVDPTAARDMLKKMGMMHFSKHYPDIWVGHWTGSDSVNSSFSPNEGEVTSLFRQQQEAPGFCAHPHAWALYAYNCLNQEATA